MSKKNKRKVNGNENHDLHPRKSARLTSVKDTVCELPEQKKTRNKPRKSQSNHSKLPLSDVDDNVAVAEKSSTTITERDNKNHSNHDLFDKILQSKNEHLNSNVCKNTTVYKITKKEVERSISVLHSLFYDSLQLKCPYVRRKHITHPVHSMVADLGLYRIASPFNRRCTALDWHPNNPNLLAVGSKAGDIILWNTEKMEPDVFLEGRGPGGSISAMKFHPHDHSKVFTSALDGKLSLQDLYSKHTTKVYLDTNTWDYWYCSMDFQMKSDIIVAGDSRGYFSLLSLRDGQKVMTEKLHKSKITHTEFSPREPWLLCTASTDKTCKLWDIRMIKDRKSSLQTLVHEKPINSARFSQTDGTRLLTTDQHTTVSIYTAPHFALEQSIQHPHRFFQHITPIKAEWHPLQDIVVIGRYPDKNFPGWVENESRTIDVFSGETGEMIGQLQDPSASGIISLNRFNPQGDTLASTMGVNILIWKRKEFIAHKQQQLMNSMTENNASTSEENVQNMPTVQRKSKSRTEISAAKRKLKTDKQSKK